MHRSIALLVLLSAVGCAGKMTVDADYDTSKDFSGYKTWAWFTDAKPQGKIDDLTMQRIRSAIEKEMPHRGITKKEEGPSVFVTFHASVNQKVDVRPTTVGVGYGWGPAHVGVSSSGTKVYDEGTLIIDILDAQSKTLIWRGTARGTVSQSSSAADRDAKIREAVEYILEGFPPPK